MSIILLLVIIAVVVAAIYFRSAIANVVVGVGYVVAGTFARAWPAMRWIFIIAVAIGILGWIAFFVLVVGLGMYANSPISAFVILVLFPMWFLAFIMPPFVNSIWVFGPVVRVVRMVFSPILIIAVICLFVGLWSPAVKGSLNRWFNNLKQTVANSVDKSSTQSEAEAGVFCFIPEGTWVYNESSQPRWKMNKGTLARALDLEGKKVEPNSEGMVRVMLPNQIGDFVGGDVGYVPSRKINWDWQGAQVEEKAAREAEASKKAAEASAKQEEVQRKQVAASSPEEKTVHAEYKWTEEKQGAVSLGTFKPGDYEIQVSESNFEYQVLRDWKVVRTEKIGPEGMVGRIFKFKSELLVPEAAYLARIVMIDGKPWQLLGSKTITLHISETSDVLVTINVRRNPDNFHNVGGDTIKIKRSGQ